MTQIAVETLQKQNQKHSSLQVSNLVEDINFFSNPVEASRALTNDINSLDEKILKLEKASKETQNGIFSTLYNVFSKKDDRLNQEINQLKAIRQAALADDGVIDRNELKVIEKEYKDAEQNLEGYKKSKKSTADLVSTLGAISAGIALATVFPPVAAAVAATAGTAAGIGTTAGATAGTLSIFNALICAAGSAVAKVGVKELMLDEEYDPASKEGMKDAAISMLYSFGGAVARCAKIADPLTKFFGFAGKSNAELLAKSTGETINSVGITLLADKDVREQVAKGDLTELSIIAATSFGAKFGVGKIKDAALGKTIADKIGEAGKDHVLSNTSYVAKNTVNKTLENNANEVVAQA
jgi:hypothetical protein